MLIEDCDWCGQKYPTPIDTERLDTISKIHLRPIDLPSCEQFVDNLLDDIDTTTTTVEYISIKLLPNPLNLLIHTTCREPFMRSMNTLFKIMSEHNLTVVRESFYNMIAEEHRLRLCR